MLEGEPNQRDLLAQEMQNLYQSPLLSSSLSVNSISPSLRYLQSSYFLLQLKLSPGIDSSDCNVAAFLGELMPTHSSIGICLRIQDFAIKVLRLCVHFCLLRHICIFSGPFHKCYSVQTKSDKNLDILSWEARS